MDPIRTVPAAAVGIGVVAAWLVPGLDPLLGLLVALLGSGVGWAIWTGTGGPYLVLCLGEAFAVGLASAAPVLGVLAQPMIAALVVGTEDRAGFVLAAGAAVAAAGGMLLFRHTLIPLVGLAAGGTMLVLALVGLEAWLRRRFMVVSA